jgi:hypothetical protein
VQLLVEILAVLCRACRRDVGRDRLVPSADAREDVRRHVLSVRGGRRNPGVSLGCIQPLFRKRRRVIEMDQVVRHAGMPRLALEDRLQNGRAFKLICVGLVIGRGGNVERDGVKDLCFVIIGVLLRQCFHGFQVSLDPRAVDDLVVIGVENGKGIDVITFALRLGTNRLSLLNGSKSERKIRCRRWSMRIIEQAQSDAPIGNPTFRIGLEDILKYLLGRLIPERVLVSHATIKPSLRSLVARGVEMNGAESLVGLFLTQGRLPK